jgi:hypothetical protein
MSDSYSWAGQDLDKELIEIAWNAQETEDEDLRRSLINMVQSKAKAVSRRINFETMKVEYLD